MKIRTQANPEVDLTPMIDCVFQLIIFFMVIMAIAVVYGVAIKFPSGGGDAPKVKRTQEKHIQVHVAQDRIYGGPEGQVTVADGILKINGEEISLTDGVLEHYPDWDDQREKGFDALQ
jgi:biopolymer transport protein ExbD